jgi:hypothetical protein
MFFLNQLNFISAYNELAVNLLTSNFTESVTSFLLGVEQISRGFLLTLSYADLLLSLSETFAALIVLFVALKTTSTLSTLVLKKSDAVEKSHIIANEGKSESLTVSFMRGLKNKSVFFHL